MGTLDIMAAPVTHYLSSQKPSLHGVSKLSRWTKLEPKNQTPATSPDQQPSSLGSQAHSSAGSDTDDSTHSGTNSQRQSPHFGQQRVLGGKISPMLGQEHFPILGGWNVNAKSFQPVASSTGGGHLQSSPHSMCQPVVGDFSYPPPPIVANSFYPAQNSTNHAYLGGIPSTFVPSAEQHRQREAADPLGIGGAEMMGVWQDPNAGLKQWQTYTGTTVWGNPDEKANLPIQRWQSFDEEACVEMLPRLDELAKKLPGTVKGWGDLPTMDSLPAPLQRVQTHQATAITQVQQRPQQNHQHHNHQTQNYHRRVHNPLNRQSTVDYPFANLAPPLSGPYQLPHNNIPQQQMGGWPSNDGFVFRQQRTGFAMNGGNNLVPSFNNDSTVATPFNSVGMGGVSGGWMCGGEMTTNDGMDLNNVSLRTEQQHHQVSSRNFAFPSTYFPFSGGDCLSSTNGAIGVGGTVNPIC
uniref:Uncharacterized protein n=1 Tax=Globodera rostochiensis TaxID=31243 RepID=A0A914HXP1_GLORO